MMSRFGHPLRPHGSRSPSFSSSPSVSSVQPRVSSCGSAGTGQTQGCKPSRKKLRVSSQAGGKRHKLLTGKVRTPINSSIEESFELDSSVCISSTSKSLRYPSSDNLRAGTYASGSRTAPQGYSSAMAADPIFQMFPEPQSQHGDLEPCRLEDYDRFTQKQYPMLHMNLNVCSHPSLADIRYANEGGGCALCDLDKNTLDSIKVLKPCEVKGYLETYNHRFTEEQINIHLAHTAREENVIDVIQNMSVDLMCKSYALANATSLRIMNCVRTHMGRQFFVPDQDMAKVHSDAVKQFIGLASTCQALMKYKNNKDTEKGQANNLLL